MNTSFQAIVAVLILCGCTSTVGPAQPELAAPTNVANIFYLASEPTPQALEKGESAALAVAERSALEFGQPNVAYPWAVDASTGGSVRASEPFRIAGRDCRRLDYETARDAGAFARSQVTVCRRRGEAWAPVV